MTTVECDIVVVGHGIAGLSAGLRSAELGLDTIVLEKAPESERGGHTAHSESFRAPSAETDLSEWGYQFDVPDYTAEDFYDDIMDTSNGKARADLAQTLVDNAAQVIEWLTSHSVKWDMEPLTTGYAAGRTWFDNDKLVDHLAEQIRNEGGEIRYRTAATDLKMSNGTVIGLQAAGPDKRYTIDADAVILAAGGYESSAEKRARHYGAGFDDMKVRGSGFNTGEVIDMALENGAIAAGQWSGAHMAIIDANAPDTGGGANRVDGYQYGLILNTDGERFVNEGEDARAHTYAKFGREIFKQPQSLGYILVDSDKQTHVRDTGPTEPITGDTLTELLEKLDLDTSQALDTIRTYNDACDPDEFDPDRLDGNAATDISPRKSNWATPLAEPPYYAYAVTGGITFGFGGVAITPNAEVKNGRGGVISGLYAAGNSTGELFYDNYPGGTGLTNGAVYGVLAVEHAVDRIKEREPAKN